jgi:hypothetical protein
MGGNNAWNVSAHVDVVYRKIFVFLHECMSASVGNTINHALPRLHDIAKLYHVTAVTVHRLDGIEARTMASNNDSTRR